MFNFNGAISFRIGIPRPWQRHSRDSSMRSTSEQICPPVMAGMSFDCITSSIAWIYLFICLIAQTKYVNLCLSPVKKHNKLFEVLMMLFLLVLLILFSILLSSLCNILPDTSHLRWLFQDVIYQRQLCLYWYQEIVFQPIVWRLPSQLSMICLIKYINQTVDHDYWTMPTISVDLYFPPDVTSSVKEVQLIWSILLLLIDHLVLSLLAIIILFLLL